MEWGLILCEIDSVMEFELSKGLYMGMNYSWNDRIQYKGSEKLLVSMGFTRIGEVGRLSLFMLIEMVTLPCYKGKIGLPNGEVVDIILCVDEQGDSSIISFPYYLFNRIFIDVNSNKVLLDAEISKLKNAIEHSNKLYLQEMGQTSILKVFL